MSVYTNEFFCSKSKGSLSSAETIVPIVMKLVRPSSVVDVGCGHGFWLSVFAEHAVADFVGVDGDYIDRQELLIPPDRFVAHDLATELRIGRTFDLVVSLEVAEHLAPDRASFFVDGLTRLGSAVLFSAAVPGQGGVNHLNEQWQDYWAALFLQRGYEVVDCIRWRVWANANVEPWYAQNTLLYVTAKRLEQHAELGTEPRPRLEALAVVHPALYLRAAANELPLRSLLAKLPSAAGRAIRKRLSPGTDGAAQPGEP